MCPPLGQIPEVWGVDQGSLVRAKQSPQQSVKWTDVGSDTPQGSLPEAKTWTAMINARSGSQGEGQGASTFCQSPRSVDMLKRAPVSQSPYFFLRLVSTLNPPCISAHYRLPFLPSSYPVCRAVLSRAWIRTCSGRAVGRSSNAAGPRSHCPVFAHPRCKALSNSLARSR
jgi:hypothetical protein